MIDKTYSLRLSTVSDEIVNGDFHTFEMFQSLKRFTQQFEIESIRVVKVVFVLGSLVMLFLSQHLMNDKLLSSRSIWKSFYFFEVYTL